MGAKSSAVGYLAIRRQASGLGTAADLTTTATNNPRYFLKYRNLKMSQMPEAQRYREGGGGGRDETLELKEGVVQDPEFEVFARPTVTGMMLQAAPGPAWVAYASRAFGGGPVSNGLVRRPSPSTPPFSTTLSASVDAGVATLVLADSPAALAANDWMAIGWGPNLEFFQSAGIVGVGTVPVACPISVGPPIQTLRYPHVAGEPIMRCKAVAWLASNTAGTLNEILVVPTALGSAFTGTRRIAISSVQNVGVTTSATTPLWGAGGNNGVEFGSTEEADTSAAAATSITISGTLSNKHSAGAWIYDVGAAAAAVPTTGMIHCFEPMTSLDGENDYFTLGRAVGSAIKEKVIDAKSEMFSLVGEAKKPLNIKTGFPSRYGQNVTTALTEDYTNQATADVPFRFQNGKYFVKIGNTPGDIELSTKMYGFDFNLNNNMAKDIFTDSIFRDQVMDLARTMDLSPKFYFQSAKAYNEIMYGASVPADGALPTADMATGYVLMDFRIDDFKRLGIWIPSVTWSGFPVETDPEPKPIQVEAKATPLKSGNLPVFLAAVYNAELGRY